MTFGVLWDRTFMKSTLLSRGASLWKINRKFSSSGRIILANWKTGQRSEVRAESSDRLMSLHEVVSILFLERVTVPIKFIAVIHTHFKTVQSNLACDQIRGQFLLDLFSKEEINLINY